MLGEVLDNPGASNSYSMLFQVVVLVSENKDAISSKSGRCKGHISYLESFLENVERIVDDYREGKASI